MIDSSLPVQLKVAGPLVEVVSLRPIEIVDEEPLSDCELTVTEALQVSLFFVFLHRLRRNMQRRKGLSPVGVAFVTTVDAVSER